MDEARHVHWHLIPRKGEVKGPELIEMNPGNLTHSEDAEEIRNHLN